MGLAGACDSRNPVDFWRVTEALKAPKYTMRSKNGYRRLLNVLGSFAVLFGTAWLLAGLGDIGHDWSIAPAGVGAAPLIQRLRRVEGQVRGLRQMIEKDRYTGDVVQQASAIVAAIREVSLLLISEHLEASARADLKPDAEETISLLKLALPKPRTDP
jgi:DNA-binding FrmR family transcriptional regulator